MKKLGPTEDLVTAALRIVEAAREQGVVLRIMGALAIRFHCQKYANLYKALNREFSDIDLVGYSKQKDKIKKVLEELGYKMRMLSYSVVMRGRLIFIDEKNENHVDVFMDKLDMCHTIDFKERLEIDYPTISLADLLLEKMQIVKISEKDIKDAILLIMEHELGNDDKEKINIGYVSKLLSKDWGFYYTVITNLNKVKKLIFNYPQITKEARATVIDKIDFILNKIEEEPKSLAWKMRAKMGGPKMKWYKDVETSKA